MFWGLVLEPGKRYAQKVERAFHISTATLDATEANPENAPVTIQAEVAKRSYVICNLSRQQGATMQQQLDLNFECDEEVAFSTKGAKSKVYLTGYLLPDEAAMYGSEEEDSEEEEDIDISGDANGMKPPKRKATEGINLIDTEAVEEEESDSDFELGEEDSEDESDSNLETTTDFESSVMTTSPSPAKKKARMSPGVTLASPATPTTPGGKKNKKNKTGPSTPHPGKQGKPQANGMKSPQGQVKTPQQKPGATPQTPDTSGKKKKKRNRKSKGGATPITA